MLHAQERASRGHAAAHRGDRLRDGPGRSERDQVTATREFALETHRYRGTYNISDFRFFGLRDNNSSGPSFQQYFGLLRDDHTEKPAFDVYRRAIARYGARDR